MEDETPVRRGAGKAVLRNVRYIPLSADEAIVAFSPVAGTVAGAAQISDVPQEVRIALIPSGADREPRKVQLLPIIKAVRLGDVDELLTVTGREIIFTLNSDDISDDRVAIRVTVHSDTRYNLERHAFRLISSG